MDTNYTIENTDSGMVSEPDMALAMQQQPLHLDITLESGAMVADIKKALKMIKGIASIRVSRTFAKNEITPALAKQIKKAQKEYESGETISCSTPEEMQRYFDSL